MMSDPFQATFTVIGIIATIALIFAAIFSMGKSVGKETEMKRWIKAARKGTSVVVKKEKEAIIVERTEYDVSVKA